MKKEHELATKDPGASPATGSDGAEYVKPQLTQHPDWEVTTGIATHSGEI